MAGPRVRTVSLLVVAAIAALLLGQPGILTAAPASPASTGENPRPPAHAATQPGAGGGNWGTWSEQNAGPDMVTGGSVTPSRISKELKAGESHQETLTINVGDVPVGKADIMFAFDLTGSMSDELGQAKTSAVNIMNQIRVQLPNAWFGVGSFMDYPACYTYPGYSACYGDAPSGDVAWRLDSSVREPITEIAGAINGLALGWGVDYPEDYTRVLYELRQPHIGWRSYTKKIVVLFGDAPTHDLNFAGYNYGGDPGPNGAGPDSDDLDFETVVADTRAAGISVIAVDSSGGAGEAVATFKGMSIGYAGAGGTGGQYFALDDASEIPAAVVSLIQTETQKIDRLSFDITEGYEGWVQLTPPYHDDVPSGQTRQSTLKITVPAGTAPGYYPFVIQVIADGAILGMTYVDIKVPTDAPVSDLGFRPNPNGFSFSNDRSEILTWPMFRQYFGSAAVEYPNGNRNWAAEQYYNLPKSGYRDAGAGLCLGFSVTSLVNFKEWDQPNAGSFSMPRHDPLYPASRDDDVKEAITFAQGTQKGLELQTWQAQTCQALNNSSWKWYEFLKSMIQTNTPAVLGISWDKNYDAAGWCVWLTNPVLKGPGAHALVPYKFEEPTADKAYVYVYDPNIPNNDKHRVEFDKTTDSWSYDWGVPLCSDIKIEGKGCSVRARPLDLYRHQGIPPWRQVTSSAAPGQPEEPETSGARTFTSSGPAALLFTDDAGRRLGWDEAGFHDEIPGANYFALETGTGAPGGGFYYIPNETSYDLEVRGKSSGLADVAVWGDGYMAGLSNLETTAGSKVELHVPASGDAITVRSVTATIRASLSLDRGLTTEDRSVTAGDLEIKPGETVALTYKLGATPGAPDSIQLSTNSPTTGAYDLALQRSGGAGLSVFGHANATFDGNSDQNLSVSNWSSLGSVTVNVDVDHDGDVERSARLEDESRPQSITLDADPTVISAGGEQALITVRVMDQFGHFVRDGSVVNFSTTLGSLSAAQGVTSGGIVQVRLTSGIKGGTARVSASSGAAYGAIDVLIVSSGVYLPFILRANEGGVTPPPAWQTSGPAGRTVLDVASSNSSCSVVYAATDIGVYRSMDGARTWNSVFAPNPPDGVPVPAFDGQPATAGMTTAVAVCSASPSVVYAASWGGGVHRSTDGGNWWQQRVAGLTDRWIYDVVVDPFNCDVAYAASSGSGVFKTTDGGGTWQAASAGLANGLTRTLLVGPTNSQRLYVGTTNGVYRSVNGAASWFATAALPAVAAWSLSTPSSSSDLVYAGLEGYGVYRSPNGGSSWEQMVVGLGNVKVRSLIVDPAAASTIYVGRDEGSGVYRSTDGGNSWTSFSSNLGDGHVKALWLDAGACHRLLAGTANGVWYLVP